MLSSPRKRDIPETTVCGTMGPRLRGDDTEYVDDTEHEEGHMT
jgi:hypothetical protein